MHQSQPTALMITTLLSGALFAVLPRLGNYYARLKQAAQLTADGDPTYIASPKVDSYHSTWLELHG
ncbi:MAG: hypothetical protein CL484_15490 [Acidobacteria bacterium]|nr:hypothetical protein [Acidobacteriota bacterium]